MGSVQLKSSWVDHIGVTTFKTCTFTHCITKLWYIFLFYIYVCRSGTKQVLTVSQSRFRTVTNGAFENTLTPLYTKILAIKIEWYRHHRKLIFQYINFNHLISFFTSVNGNDAMHWFSNNVHVLRYVLI